MALSLLDQDLVELLSIINDFRHKEASALIAFLGGKQQKQQAELAAAAEAEKKAAEATPELPLQNGHAEQRAH